MHDYDSSSKKIIVVFEFLLPSDEKEFDEWTKTFPLDKSYYEMFI